MKRCHSVLSAIAGFWLASTCGAAGNSFRMTAMFSDKAGLIQYIQLQELSGLDGQEYFAGLTLVVTSRAGRVKSITLPNDLPGSSTANSFALIGTRQYPGDPLVDFALPPGFLPTDGGTLVFAGVDVWDYQELPANGYTVLTRTGPTTNPPEYSGWLARSFTGRMTGLIAITDPVIEYYNQMLDHYFISASQPDIDALDSGRIPGWKRTGELFTAWTSPLLLSAVPYGDQSPPGMRSGLPPLPAARRRRLAFLFGIAGGMRRRPSGASCLRNGNRQCVLRLASGPGDRGLRLRSGTGLPSLERARRLQSSLHRVARDTRFHVDPRVCPGGHWTESSDDVCRRRNIRGLESPEAKRSACDQRVGAVPGRFRRTTIRCISTKTPREIRGVLHCPLPARGERVGVRGYSPSKNERSFSDRDGCRSLRSAFASIWRMRSRVTSNCLPTSSSV